MRTTRAMQSRKATQRPKVQATEYDPMGVPEAPPGMTYGWIRRAVLNQEDAFNMRERSMQGWKPVPSDRHPEMTPEGWAGVMSGQKTYIENAGLLLCECPTAALRQRKTLQDQLTRSRLKMPHIEMERRAAAPTFDDSKTGFERVVAEKVDPDAEFQE